jgi:hypothetical protein
MRQGECDHAADVMADDVHALVPKMSNQLRDILGDRPFVVTAGGSLGQTETSQIRGDYRVRLS